MIYYNANSLLGLFSLVLLRSEKIKVVHVIGSFIMFLWQYFIKMQCCPFQQGRPLHKLFWRRIYSQLSLNS